MELMDKNLTCKDCGETFVFSAGEQEFYADKGFENDPVRCLECRKARKAKYNSFEHKAKTSKID